jgi:transketolase
VTTEAIRQAYGEALVKAGAQYGNLIVLDADVSNSTRSIEFGAAYPDRYFNIGISEANMVCIAAGMAAEGMLPVVNTFGFLLCEHCLDQIRASVAQPKMNVKFAANYGGLSDSYDGASHHTITDLTVMRAIPNMTTVVLSDAPQIRGMLKKILDFEGPLYFRLCRAPTTSFHDETEEYEIGKAVELRKGNDITIIAAGIPVYQALLASDLLGAEGIDAAVVEMHTIKPLDAETVLRCAEKGPVLTCEESNTLGGLGSAVAEVIVSEKPVPMKILGIMDRFSPSGSYDELLDYNGLTAGHIAKAAGGLLRGYAKRNANN